jgi:hypothetical protein
MQAELHAPEGRAWTFVLGTEEKRFGGAGVGHSGAGTVLDVPAHGAVLLRSRPRRPGADAPAQHVTAVHFAGGT